MLQSCITMLGDVFMHLLPDSVGKGIMFFLFFFWGGGLSGCFICLSMRIYIIVTTRSHERLELF